MICHLSFVIRHLSFVIRHLSFVTFPLLLPHPPHLPHPSHSQNFFAPNKIPKPTLTKSTDQHAVVNDKQYPMHLS